MFGPKKRIHCNSLCISNYKVSENEAYFCGSCTLCVHYVYACMCVCIYVHVYPCAHVCKWRPEVHVWCHSSGTENVSYMETWGLPFRLGWLPIEPQGSTDLHPSLMGLQARVNTSAFPCGVLEVQFCFSCSSNKHFAYWASTPAHDIVFTVSWPGWCKFDKRLEIVCPHMCLFWHFGPMPGKAEIFANALCEWLRKLWFGRTNPPWVTIGNHCLPELPLMDTYWPQHVEGWPREQTGMNFCSPHCRCVSVIGSEELKFLSSQVTLTSLVYVFRWLSQLRT